MYQVINPGLNSKVFSVYIYFKCMWLYFWNILMYLHTHINKRRACLNIEIFGTTSVFACIRLCDMDKINRVRNSKQNKLFMCWQHIFLCRFDSREFVIWVVSFFMCEIKHYLIRQINLKYGKKYWSLVRK